MAKRGHSEEEILRVLREAESGTTVVEVCNTAAAGGGYNAFVTKLNSEGSDLKYSTYLGGSGGSTVLFFNGDFASGITVDASGHAYVTGYTNSPDFPVTSGAFQRVNNAAANDGNNAFVTKLNLEGSDLKYSTYLGGSGQFVEDYFGYGDSANGIALDASGHAYVTGSTSSTDFPVTSGAFQKVNNAPGIDAGNAFVTKLNSEGSALEYSTYLGGSGNADTGVGDSASGIAMDAAGNVYIAGLAYSTDYPVTSGAFQKVNKAAANDGSNAFVTKLNFEGSDLKYSTYLGGSSILRGSGVGGGDGASAISLDVSGHAYVTGYTDSTDFPVTSGAFQKVNKAAANDGNNAFVTELNFEGSDLKYSTYLGGSSSDYAAGIAMDAAGNVYIAGLASSADFPVTSDAFRKHKHAAAFFASNAFVAKFTW